MQKDDMWSGAWSVIVISNNGDADPIAYERDFNLVVGTPVTVVREFKGIVFSSLSQLLTFFS